MKKVYIAGKVTGESIAECTMKFGTMQKDIEALGFEVINPLELVCDWKTPWNKAMRICVSKLTECDAIVLLPDWTKSQGAKVEYEISKMLSIPNFRGSKFGLQDLKMHKWSNI